MSEKIISNQKVENDFKIWAQLLNIPANSSPQVILEKIEKNNNIINSIEATNEINNKYRSNWTIEDYLREDPDALIVMAEENPQKFNNLNKMYFADYHEASKEHLSDAYQNASKRILRKAKQQLQQLTKEQQEEFRELYPAEYKKIMSS